jgi:hypothetical protein
MPEKEADHRVAEDPVDEHIDDLPQLRLAAELLIKGFGHGSPPQMTILPEIDLDVNAWPCFRRNGTMEAGEVQLLVKGHWSFAPVNRLTNNE